jgi:hypothetical protein
MRHFLFGLATLVATTVAASAQPALTAVPSEASPSAYVRGGFEGGANDGYFTAGGMLEVGARVAPNLWIHGTAAKGGAAELFGKGSGSYLQAHAGVDVLRCNGRGTACGYAGADLGLQHVQWTGVEGALFEDPADETTVSYDRTKMIGVGRIGVDIGGKHVRWRPGVEVSVSNTGLNGINLIQSIACRF